MSQKNNTFMLNNRLVTIGSSPGVTLLTILRDHFNIKGVKEGCSEGECGACTIIVGVMKNNEPAYSSRCSCLTPADSVDNSHIVTIEGLSENSPNVIQQAFIDHGAVQCGFCTPGFIISLTAFFISSPVITTEKAIESLDGNICRCTGYVSIARACRSLVEKYGFISEYTGINRLEILAKHNLIPSWFPTIQNQLTHSTIEKRTVKKRSAHIIAGGTDITLSNKFASNNRYDYTSDIDIEDSITSGDDKIVIGAAVTTTTVKDSTLFSHFGKEWQNALYSISSTPIRNAATVGGNIVNASPIADLAIIMLALDARVIISGGAREKEIALKDFYKGYKKTRLTATRYISRVIIDHNITKRLFSFEKVAKRSHLDIASVNSAITISVDSDMIIRDIALSAGAAAPFPLRLSTCESFLTGQKVSHELLLDAADIIYETVSPISDVRGSAMYKKKLLIHLFYSHFIKLFPEIIHIEELV